MNNQKRALISIFRQPIKSILLFLLITGLSIFVAIILSIDIAISNTTTNLRRNMLPVTQTSFDWRDITVCSGEDDGTISCWSDPEIPYEDYTLRLEHIRTIGASEWVRTYEYTIRSVFYTSFDFMGICGGHWLDGYIFCPDVPRLRGFSTHQIAYFENEILEMTHGRMFNEFDFTAPSEPFPLIINSHLAEGNGIEVGTILNLYKDLSWLYGLEVDEGNMSLGFDFEIVGIFDLVDDLYDGIWCDTQCQGIRAEFVSSIFSPFPIIYEMTAWELDIVNSNLDLDIPWRLEVTGTYLLYDVDDLDRFIQFANTVLPHYINLIDLSSTFHHLTASMTSVQELTSHFFVGAILAVILVTTLTLQLFLYDRRKEIGIYLALGSKRMRIIAQILIEVSLITVFGITIALFIGNQIAGEISNEMISSEIINLQRDEFAENFGHHVFGSQLESRGFAQQLTYEEMMNAFNVRLDARTVTMFYIIGFATVTVSTIIPTIYIVKLSPKKVLL